MSEKVQEDQSLDGAEAPDPVTEIPELPSTAVPKERPGQPGGRRDRNRRERVRALTEAAVGLFLEQGISGTTIDDITKAAGVSKGSFYRYFEDKAELVAFAFAPLRTEMAEAFARCGLGLDEARATSEMMRVYEDLGADLAGSLLRHSEAALLYLQENRAPSVGAREPIGELRDLITDKAVELTHIAHRHGVLRPFPDKLSAIVVVGAVERLVFGLLKGEDIGDPLKLAEHVTSLILDGLAAR